MKRPDSFVAAVSGGGSFSRTCNGIGPKHMSETITNAILSYRSEKKEKIEA